MLFSVVILSYNSQRTLDRCLNELELALGSFSEPSEIFVIENGSHDSSRIVLEEHYSLKPDLYKPIILSENTGTTASRNLALKTFSGKYVLVLDSDAYISASVLTELQSVLDNNDKIGLVAPKLRYADGRFQLSTDRFPTLFRKLQRFLSLGSIQSMVNEEDLITGPVDYAISACWLLKKETVEAAGLFDETIFYSPEDVDYCLQIWRSGYEVHYHPKSEMIHDAQERSRGFKLTKFHFSHLKGLFYLFFKYRYFFSIRSLRQPAKKGM